MQSYELSYGCLLELAGHYATALMPLLALLACEEVPFAQNNIIIGQEAHTLSSLLSRQQRM